MVCNSPSHNIAIPPHTMSIARRMRFYDIALNLTDPMFFGVYRGKQKHEPDTYELLHRAYDAGVHASMVTGSSIEGSIDAISLVKRLSHKDHIQMKLFYTVGVHPCTVNEFMAHTMDGAFDIHEASNDPDHNDRLYRQVIENPQLAVPKLRELHLLQEKAMHDPHFRAVGEIGLDYDRLNYSSKEMQMLFFEEQLKIACMAAPSKPLFLHMRNCAADFISILRKFINGFTDTEDNFNWIQIAPHRNIKHGSTYYKLDPTVKFVVHSFTDSLEDMKELLALSPNCYIGINGCSLRDQTNIESVRQLPLERLLLETDAPWCEIRPSHASSAYLQGYDGSRYKHVKKEKLDECLRKDETNVLVKSRNEPCNMEQVAVVVANIKELPVEEVAERAWENSCDIYGL